MSLIRTKVDHGDRKAYDDGCGQIAIEYTYQYNSLPPSTWFFYPSVEDMHKDYLLFGEFLRKKGVIV